MGNRYWLPAPSGTIPPAEHRKHASSAALVSGGSGVPRKLSPTDAPPISETPHRYDKASLSRPHFRHRKKERKQPQAILTPVSLSLCLSPISSFIWTVGSFGRTRAPPA